MNMDRRQFLKTSLAGAAGLAMGARLGFSADTKVDPCELVPLGKTGIKISRIGCGTGMTGGGRASNMTRMGKEAFEAVLKHAYDVGIRLFDMADMYGTHPFVASALQDKPREKLVYVTKMWMHPGGKALPEPERPDADVLVERFRKELKTDYIDLLLIHCMFDGKWPDTFKKQMDIMDGLKAKGLIKAHGVSVHSLGALKAAAESTWVDSAHVRINAFGVNMDGKPEEVAPIVKKMHDDGKGIIGMKLIGEGKFRNEPEKKDELIKFVLGLGAVDCMAVGFEKIAEIDDFVARVSKVMAAKG